MPNSRQPVLTGHDSKSTFKSKVFGDISKGRSFKIDGMSPEAKKAMLLTKMDSKEGASATHGSLAHNIKSTKNSNPKQTLPVTGDTRISGKASVKMSPLNINTADTSRFRKQTNSSFDSGINVTAPSRSTLSYTAKTFSLSDNNDVCDSGENNKNNNLEGPTLLAAAQNEKDLYKLDAETSRKVTDQNDGDALESARQDAEVNNEEAQVSSDKTFPKSFVLALDKALEEQCISRLRGDITDTVGLCETGKVRALNGGRLANAQEVVVNVCHDDDKEIVFHDDDDETLDTAKTISHIRVNIWMEYNKDFEPEHDTVSEVDYPTVYSEADKTKDDKESPNVLKAAPKSPREKTLKPTTNKNLLKQIRTEGRAIGKDSNNNNSRSVGSSRSISGTNFSSRAASSKNGSVLTEDSKKSNSWSRKSEQSLRKISQK
ncbi:hypothetical protein BgiMline_022924 [Biomphalaria glabrata]|nr:WD repeat-containing protein 48-like protein [Biomphalaria glabrata]